MADGFAGFGRPFNVPTSGARYPHKGDLGLARQELHGLYRILIAAGHVNQRNVLEQATLDTLDKGTKAVLVKVEISTALWACHHYFSDLPLLY